MAGRVQTRVSISPEQSIPGMITDASPRAASPLKKKQEYILVQKHVADMKLAEFGTPGQWTLDQTPLSVQRQERDGPGSATSLGTTSIGTSESAAFGDDDSDEEDDLDKRLWKVSEYKWIRPTKFADWVSDTFRAWWKTDKSALALRREELTMYINAYERAVTHTTFTLSDFLCFWAIKSHVGGFRDKEEQKEGNRRLIGLTISDVEKAFLAKKNFLDKKALHTMQWYNRGRCIVYERSGEEWKRMTVTSRVGTEDRLRSLFESRMRQLTKDLPMKMRKRLRRKYKDYFVDLDAVERDEKGTIKQPARVVVHLAVLLTSLDSWEDLLLHDLVWKQDAESFSNQEVAKRAVELAKGGIFQMHMRSAQDAKELRGEVWHKENQQFFNTPDPAEWEKLLRQAGRQETGDSRAAAADRPEEYFLNEYGQFKKPKGGARSYCWPEARLGRLTLGHVLLNEP